MNCFNELKKRHSMKIVSIIFKYLTKNHIKSMKTKKIPHVTSQRTHKLLIMFLPLHILERY